MRTVFVDSNVVIYSLDRSNPLKHAQAQEWLRRLGRSNRLTMSPQVLNEAYAVLTLKHRLDPHGVRAALVRLGRWITAPLNLEVMIAGWKLQDRYGVRVWDALLLASANSADCSCFLSEDLNDGRRYGAVEVVNPFRHAPEDVLGRASQT